MRLLFALALAFVLSAVPAASLGLFASADEAPRSYPPYSRPTLIAHRGDSGRAPEHTLTAYSLAIDAGADFVEPDLQITRDGVLICLHDMSLERTTNVATVFPDRARMVQDKPTWPVADFTLDEIRRLDAGSWKGAEFAGLRVPTFQEMIDHVRGRAGIIPETKAPDAYKALGFDMPGLLMAVLRQNGLDVPGADPKTPVVIQSFSRESLQALRETHGCELPLIALLSQPEQATSEAIAGLKGLVQGVAPSKDLVQKVPTVIDEAHQAGLSVTVWTFRAGRTEPFGSVRDEMAHYLHNLGIDAVFTDNPDQFPRR